MKDKLAAALLAIFLGGIGVHKFYLREYTKGAFYLLFFWTFIPSILAIIDFVILLTMNDQDFHYKYNYDYDLGYQESGPEGLDLYSKRNSESVLDLDRLEKLAKLRDSGVITEHEFLMEKERLMNY